MKRSDAIKVSNCMGHMIVAMRRKEFGRDLDPNSYVACDYQGMVGQAGRPGN